MRFSRILAILLVVGVVFVMGVSAVLVYAVARDFTRDWELSISGVLPTQIPRTRVPTALPQAAAPTTQITQAASTPTPQAVADAGGGGSDETSLKVDLEGIASVEPLPETTGRVTVLMLGVDERPFEDEKGWHTDTMMLISLDTVSKSVSILSVPRDLWVSIPRFKPGKINTANFLGDYYDYPPDGRGPVLAVQTVAQNIGVKADYYVVVNFEIFKALVNVIAPVEVCVKETIDDPDYPEDGGYGTIHVHFDPGCQEMDSTRLLQYARNRATEGSDFDRAARQQQVIRAVLDRALSIGGAQALIGSVGPVWNAIKDSIRTNMPLDVALSTGLFVLQNVTQDDITSVVLDTKYVYPATVTDPTSGLDVSILMPYPDAIRGLVLQLFTSQPEVDTEQLESAAAGEGASITVLNGTTVAGLAGSTKDRIARQGLTVANVGNADESSYTESVIYTYSAKPNTARYLAEFLGIPATAIVPGPPDFKDGSDVVVILGQDYAGQ